MVKIKHKTYCSECKTEENLMKHSVRTNKDGSKTQYYKCADCNSKRQKYWYNKSPENRIKQQIFNMRSVAKRFGYVIKEK